MNPKLSYIDISEMLEKLRERLLSLDYDTSPPFAIRQYPNIKAGTTNNEVRAEILF